jgi:hypothetical protein
MQQLLKLRMPVQVRMRFAALCTLPAAAGRSRAHPPTRRPSCSARALAPAAQVAFLQGMVPLQDDALFPRLHDLLTQCPVWSVNLGELRFSEAQCEKLAETLRASGVTHLFYECTVAGQWKEEFRDIIRINRAKHGMWRFGPDCEQNRVILAAVKNWCAPHRAQPGSRVHSARTATS